jgi:hypothetical protein
MDEKLMQDVFDRYADSNKGLSKAALMSALREVGAPVLTGKNSPEEDEMIFRRADANLDGSVNFKEYWLARHAWTCFILTAHKVHEHRSVTRRT